MKTFSHFLETLCTSQVLLTFLFTTALALLFARYIPHGLKRFFFFFFGVICNAPRLEKVRMKEDRDEAMFSL
jgi:hypothetical protein